MLESCRLLPRQWVKFPDYMLLWLFRRDSLESFLSWGSMRAHSHTESNLSVHFQFSQGAYTAGTIPDSWEEVNSLSYRMCLGAAVLPCLLEGPQKGKAARGLLGSLAPGNQLETSPIPMSVLAPIWNQRGGRHFLGSSAALF